MHSLTGLLQLLERIEYLLRNYISYICSMDRFLLLVKIIFYKQKFGIKKLQTQLICFDEKKKKVLGM